MDYYHCPPEQLWQEIFRRGEIPCGGHDELSERLAKDDIARGSEATTVATGVKRHPASRSRNQIAEYGEAIDPRSIVNERIVHWKMNTFFPTLQLFFESGRSCTIEGGRLRGASVGIDSDLRFRLTDLMHEEDGEMIKSPLPEKFAGPIRILDCVLAERISISVKPVANIGMYRGARMEHEAHTVIGLKLEGMTDVGYVWARTDAPFGNDRDGTWGDLTIGGLRDDIPAPFFFFPQKGNTRGSVISVVKKGSMISNPKEKGT
ncbi:hypothetical protein K504DRAFT_448950 [Pleomassaria siparia CBS 279.74]|uniref:Uncharacterized protein n=1 Tax=Pleomassaria siparia CBS 279.74 TaxID=1314801 RepID=A0A6G1JXQ6_9PLEO|nr:hypothetical protein K504DRAFT_448950 [Pleomassaria siparia CBS 279.74]